jgi:ABC-2 type transport system permease protein
MTTIIQILIFEIRQFVRRGSFWFGFFAIPALSVFLSVVVLGNTFSHSPNAPTLSTVGIIDESSLMSPAQMALYAQQLRIFTDRSSAIQALAKGQITRFYLVPRTYLSDGHVFCYLASQQPFKTGSPKSETSISNLLRLAISGGLVSGPRAELYQNPLHVHIIYVHDSIQTDGGGSDGASRITTPALLTIMFCSVVLFSGGYLLNSVNIERQNKVFESLCARVSPVSLILGKWLSIGLISVTQQVVYVAFVIWQARHLGIQPIESRRLAMAVTELVLGYALISLSTLVIGLVTKAGQDSTQLGLAAMMILVAPVLIVLAPRWDSGLPRILSICPFTAPVAMLLRICFTDVPASDIVLSLSATIIATAGVMIVGCAVLRSSATGGAGLVFRVPLQMHRKANPRTG